MARRNGIRSVIRCTLVLVGVAVTASTSMPDAAHSQGFFDFLRGIFGPPPQQRMPPMMPDGFPGRAPQVPGDDVRVPGDGGGPHATYCVRLCDGRYFPISANAGSQSSQQLCSAMCPAAKTEIYSGSGIEHATSSGGRPYSSMPNAFAYRDRLVDGCTCNGQSATGLAKIDVESDPTLRPGDIVTTKDGQSVFKGDRRLPHKSSEFVPIQQQKQATSSTRRGRSAPVPVEGRAASVPNEPATTERNQALGFVPDQSKVRRVGPLD